MKIIKIELHSSLEYLEEDLRKVVESANKNTNPGCDEIHINVVI